MRKINVFVPVIGLAAILAAFQAPTVSEYMSDTSELQARIQTCLNEVANPANDLRCINASAAATHYWQTEMNTTVAEVNAQYEVVKSMVENCQTVRCTAAITETKESKALEAAQAKYQKLKAVKPPKWKAS